MEFEDLENINDQLVYIGDSPEQYKDAIVGLTYDNNHLIYSVEKFIECLVKEGMTYEEAEEWIGYNTDRACQHMGEFKPILMYDVNRFSENYTTKFQPCQVSHYHP